MNARRSGVASGSTDALGRRPQRRNWAGTFTGRCPGAPALCRAHCTAERVRAPQIRAVRAACSYSGPLEPLQQHQNISPLRNVYPLSCHVTQPVCSLLHQTLLGAQALSACTSVFLNTHRCYFKIISSTSGHICGLSGHVTNRPK